MLLKQGKFRGGGGGFLTFQDPMTQFGIFVQIKGHLLVYKIGKIQWLLIRLFLFGHIFIFTCTSTRSLDKSCFWMLGFYLICSTGIRWNQLQKICHCVTNLKMFFIEMENENCEDWKSSSDWLADNNIMSRASSSATFR